MTFSDCGFYEGTLILLRFCHHLLIEDVYILQKRTGDSGSFLPRKSSGSNEPELSIARTNDLERLIRPCEILQMDHGHEMGDRFDAELPGLRTLFYEILGKTG